MFCPFTKIFQLYFVTSCLMMYVGWHLENYFNLNILQRVHQNTLERVTVFLTILLAAGLFNPKMAAAFGFTWIIGRVIYSLGYYSGVPNNRIAGASV